MSSSIRASGKASAGRQWAASGSWRALPRAWAGHADGTPRPAAAQSRHAQIQARVEAARARHERYAGRPPRQW